MENGFQGKENQKIPPMTDKIIGDISDRYIELYEQITGDRFVKYNTARLLKRVEENILNFLKL